MCLLMNNASKSGFYWEATRDVMMLTLLQLYEPLGVV